MTYFRFHLIALRKQLAYYSLTILLEAKLVKSTEKKISL